MRDLEILDRDYNRLCWITNEAELGLHYYGDSLSTTIDSGVYTLELIIPKRTTITTERLGINLGLSHFDKMSHVKEGNFLRFKNRQHLPLLMTIKNIVENSDEKRIYAEDVTISLINSIVDGMETPTEPQAIEYYLSPVLTKTGFLIGTNECDRTQILELSGTQNALERVRHICQAFEMEFYFRVIFDDLKKPKFYIHIVEERLEGDLGFRISTDDVVGGIERSVNTDNIITKLILRGKAKETNEVAETEEKEEVKQEETVNNNIERVIEIARQQLGKPYVWGANGPNSFDCSGFVSYSFRTAGYPGYPTSGRPTTNSMWDLGGIHTGYFTRISRADLKRGDIIMYDTGYTYPGDANHVGIYIGNDQVIHAGSPVQIQGAHSMKAVGYLRVKGG